MEGEVGVGDVASKTFMGELIKASEQLVAGEWSMVVNTIQY